MIKDMTKGNPLKLILLFSIPLLIGNLFQQLYNVVDTLIVGRTLGKNALAAVGAVGALVFAVIGFCFGMSSGFGVIIAQRFGAKDEAGLRRSVTHSVVLSVIATIILTAACVPCTRLMLRAMRTPPELLAEATIYLRILFIGLGATFFYNTLSAVIRALATAALHSISWSSPRSSISSSTCSSSCGSTPEWPARPGRPRSHSCCRRCAACGLSRGTSPSCGSDGTTGAPTTPCTPVS